MYQSSCTIWKLSLTHWGQQCSGKEKSILFSCQFKKQKQKKKNTTDKLLFQRKPLLAVSLLNLIVIKHLLLLEFLYNFESEHFSQSHHGTCNVSMPVTKGPPFPPHASLPPPFFFSFEEQGIEPLMLRRGGGEYVLHKSGFKLITLRL